MNFFLEKLDRNFHAVLQIHGLVTDQIPVEENLLVGFAIHEG